MINFALVDPDDKDNRLYGIGFTFAELDRLRSGKPIKFPGKQLGFPEKTEFFICADVDHKVMSERILGVASKHGVTIVEAFPGTEEKQNG